MVQRTRLGSHTPPHVLIDIRETQAALHPIKAWLQAAGVLVEDEPNDEAQVAIDATRSHQPGQSAGLTINNPAPNQGAQGIFHGPVSFHQTSPTSSVPPAFQVPYPSNALFVGREHELERLAALLDSQETIAVVPGAYLEYYPSVTLADYATQITGNPGTRYSP